ncbi:hypothetical protein GGF43_002548, partial [Coemansia sp. RSA 2618]
MTPHPTIQKRINAFSDLIPIEFHAQWGHSDAQFIEGRMVQTGIIDTPRYWFSPAKRSHLGFWEFISSFDGPIQEPTLFTLIDDVTGELAYRAFLGSVGKKDGYIGFTVNLNITRFAAMPRARTFYFEATATRVSGRKVLIECPLYDAESSVLLMVARAVFVFMPLADIANKISAPSGDHALEPRLDAPDACEIAISELHQLGQVMNFLPHGVIVHTGGLFSAGDARLLVSLDFGTNISGPPIYVHGGVLATVLYNASALLLAKTTGVNDSLADPAERDINYLKGVPLECQNAVIEAVVEATDSNRVVIFAKLMHDKHTYTTLKTTFALPQTS